MKKSVFEVLERLNNKGYEAYLVGGAVRNFLLGMEIHDYDITTSADPNAVKLIFDDYPQYDIGRKLGTVAIKVDGEKLEITPFRKEGKYSDHRHPEDITYTDRLEDDLKRRDFTVNALCMDKDQRIIDLYHGIEDLNDHIIRAIGNPDTRFNEDALRILRALRFKTKLGFEIEKETEESLFRNRDLLKHISMERKRDELIEILSYPGSFRILRGYKEIFDTFIELNNIDKDINNFSDPLYALAYLYENNEFNLKELKLSKEQIDLIKVLSSFKNLNMDDEYTFISSLANNYPMDCLRYLEQNYGIDYREKYEELKDYIIQLNDLDIDGNTLMDMGFEGKKIAEVKMKLLKLVHMRKICNERDVLLKYIKQNSL